MKRTAHPPLSPAGQEALAAYEHWLREREDLTQASIRNYLSDLRHFISWFEIEREADVHDHIITYDPSVAIKLIGQEESAPRHLDDQEEQALVAVVTKAGNLRDRVLIVLLLHTGLRAREVCRLRCDQFHLVKRSGFLEIVGKRNKYREVPLNATARKLLEGYLATFPAGIDFLFPSDKTKEALSEQALGYIVNKYARVAKLSDVSPRDLRQSVQVHRLTQIMSHDSLDTTKLYIQRTKHNLQQAVETIAWT